MSEEISKDSLHKSVEQVGRLYPRLVNQDGKILDGNHRTDTDKDWETKIVQTENRFKELLVRAHAHHRRRVPQEETRALIEEMAEALEKDGVSKTEVAAKLVQCLPYNEGYTRSLIPNVYKNPLKVQAGQVGGVKSALLSEQTVKTQDDGHPISNLEDCDNCLHPTHISKLKTLDGKDLCPLCYEHKFRVPKAETQSPVKPVESWTQRKAVMSPGVSKMDEKVFVALQNNKTLRDAGWTFQFQEVFIVKEVKDDVTARKGEVVKPLFLDGPPHEGKEDRDEANRDLLRRRLQISDKARLGFAYEGAYSDVKRDELVKQIAKELSLGSDLE